MLPPHYLLNLATPHNLTHIHTCMSASTHTHISYEGFICSSWSCQPKECGVKWIIKDDINMSNTFDNMRSHGICCIVVSVG